MERKIRYFLTTVITWILLKILLRSSGLWKFKLQCGYCKPSQCVTHEVRYNLQPFRIHTSTGKQWGFMYLLKQTTWQWLNLAWQMADCAGLSSCFCTKWLPTQNTKEAPVFPIFLNENFQLNLQQGNESWNESKVTERRIQGKITNLAEGKWT